VVAVRLTVALLLVSCASRRDDRPRIERPTDLPTHTYRVPPQPGRLVVDAAAFGELARLMRADLEHDLAVFDIRDPAVQKNHLFNLAMLDALDGKWDSAIVRLDRATALETIPAQKHMMGLTIRVWAAAITAGRDDATGFREALEKKLAKMPLELVREDLRQFVTIAGLVTPQFCQQTVELQIGRKSTIALEEAQGVVLQRWLYLRLIPVAPSIPEVVNRATQPSPSRAP
jgi:hypothetical protein